MIQITFPDGSKRDYDQGITGLSVANSISKSLAKEAMVVKFNGALLDLDHPLNTNGTIEIVTKNHEDALELLRHDTAHLLAEAAKELFPEAQVTIGPAIENGFYYDFYREKSFTPEDLIALEKRMHEIVARDEKITREEWDRDEAVTFFEGQGETFKAELIKDLPTGEVISLYRQGNFIDLCRGPHLPSTKRIGKAFKLMKLAGAYWRGDSTKPMLQRIYGTAWVTEEDLKDYLYRLEEAEKRDHRRLGKEMDLFHFQEEAQGAPFWHPKGWQIYLQLQNYIRQRLKYVGYQEINTPLVVDRKLWEASGHWEKFHEHMYLVTAEGEERISGLKPMNCPCHIQVFNQGLKSYRDLPMRFAEFGCCHRYEHSGALHGLMRVRQMVQDDGHIFCTQDQIGSETKNFFDLLQSVYTDLGFEQIHVRFSDRPEVRSGDDATWDKAEEALRSAIESTGVPYVMNPGEGAFYGPKLEFVLKDAIGREWQCGTFQLDFILPERLGATYIGEDGQKHIPVMIHRAVLGTFERFTGILIEHYAGKLPLWLAPIQVVIATITNDFDAYALDIVESLEKMGLRVETDFRNEKISYKIREHSHKKIPYILTVGAKEVAEKTIAVRKLGASTQETLALADVVATLGREAASPLDKALHVNNN